MKLNLLLLGALSGAASAFPGLKELMTDLAKRQGPPVVPAPLIGDLKTQGATTAVGKQVLACIQGTGPCENNEKKVYINAISSLARVKLTSTRHTRLHYWAPVLAVTTPAASGTMSPKTSSICSPSATEHATDSPARLYASASTMPLLGMQPRHSAVQMDLCLPTLKRSSEPRTTVFRTGESRVASSYSSMLSLASVLQI
jgi:hypothetical protein